VFAGYVAYTDHEIGRVIQEVEDEGKLDNTLIIYIDGDNGTSPEGTLLGTPNQYTAYNGILDFPVAEQLKFYDIWGSAATYPHMAVAWSWAFDTPFKWTKQIASHFGGTRQGMAISWPARIKDAGGIRTQFHHIIDIVPTILDVTGIKPPEVVNGIKQKPIEGVSMAYTFDKANANAPSIHKIQYFEMVSKMRDGKPVRTSKVHFGYTDGISQTTVRGGPERYPPDHQKPCEPWLFVNFEYVNADGSGDLKGVRCPVGAHMRRINPRGQPVTGQGQPGGSNNTHRLIRRGMPYGLVYDPTQPYDGIERGLLGYFINSNIENQYEFVLSQ
jgi:hypothetical protein